MSRPVEGQATSSPSSCARRSDQHRTDSRPPLPSPFDASLGYSRFGSGPFSTFARLTVRPPPSFIQGSPIMAWGKSSVSVRGMWPEACFAREDGLFHCTLSRSWSLAVRDGFAGVLATVPRWFRCWSEPLALSCSLFPRALPPSLSFPGGGTVPSVFGRWVTASTRYTLSASCCDRSSGRFSLRQVLDEGQYKTIQRRLSTLSRQLSRSTWGLGSRSHENFFRFFLDRATRPDRIVQPPPDSIDRTDRPQRSTSSPNTPARRADTATRTGGRFQRTARCRRSVT